MAVRVLTGAIAVVTGAGAGIGASTARHLARPIRTDPDVVMVGIEGHIGHHARNLLPRPINELAARQGLDR